MKRALLTATILCSITATSARAADTIYFPASCSKKSEMRQMPLNEPVTRMPLTCNAVILSRLDNGHFVVHFLRSEANDLPIAFAGPQAVRSSDFLRLLTLPVQHLYLPATGDQSIPADVDNGSECIFSAGTNDIMALHDIACAAAVSNAGQRTVYGFEAHIIDPGKRLSVEQKDPDAAPAPQTSEPQNDPQTVCLKHAGDIQNLLFKGHLQLDADSLHGRATSDPDLTLCDLQAHVRPGATKDEQMILGLMILQNPGLTNSFDDQVAIRTYRDGAWRISEVPRAQQTP